MRANNNLVINLICFSSWLEVIAMIEYPYYGAWSPDDIHNLKVQFIRQSREKDFNAEKIDFEAIYLSIINKMGKDAPRLSDIHC